MPTPTPPERHVANEPTPFAMVPEALLYDPSLSDKAVRLYAVLRRHGDDPENCYPSKRRLSDLMGCSPSSLGRPAKELEDAGWIARVARFDALGAPTSNGYFVHAARRSSATPAQESADPHSTRAREARAGERAEREPVEREPVERETRDVALPLGDVPEVPGAESSGWAVFWQRYPRADGKPAAERAWAKAVRVADPETILAGLDRWDAYWTARAQPEFVPWAQKWLNQQQWNAAPPAVRTVPGPGPRAPIATDRSAPTGRVVDL